MSEKQRAVPLGGGLAASGRVVDAPVVISSSLATTDQKATLPTASG